MKSRWPIFLLVFLVTGRLTAGPAALKQLHSFGLTNLAAANPYCRLLQAGDGLLYGTTSAGGAFGQGTIFRISADGGQFQVLHSFGAGTNDGARPFAALVEGSDGFLYGTTEEGGQYGFGTLFQLSKGATTFSLLKSFSGGSDGAYPEAALFEASDHLLYGTASGGGSNDYGVVFRVAKDGSAFTTLVQFQGTNGANPEAELIEASDGLLYGTTSATDSLTNAGTVFRLQKNGTGFSMLKRFFFTSSIRTNGASPLGGLVEGTNGLLFGTTSAGGANSMGAVFQLNKDGTGYRTIYSFSSNKTLDGRIPLGELLLASDGVLYGTTYDG